MACGGGTHGRGALIKTTLLQPPEYGKYRVPQNPRPACLAGTR